MISLGTRGIFKGKAPFELPNSIQQCVEISTIQQLLRRNIPIWELSYEPYVARTAYNQDVKFNVTVLTLEDDAGNIRYHPEIYVQALELNDYLEYKEVALVINLGSHSTHKTFSELIGRVKSMVREVEGVIPAISTAHISKAETVSYSKHIDILHDREVGKANVQDPYTLIKERDAYIGVLEARLRNFVLFVTQYIESCASSDLCCGSVEFIEDVRSIEAFVGPDVPEILEEGCLIRDIAEAPDADLYYCLTSRR